MPIRGPGWPPGRWPRIPITQQQTVLPVGSLNQDYTFGADAPTVHNAEALKSQVWRSAVAGATPRVPNDYQNPPQVYQDVQPVQRGPSLAPTITPTVRLSYQVPQQAYQDSTGQQWNLLLAGATPRVPNDYQVPGQDPTQIAAQQWASVTAGPGFLGKLHTTLEQPQDRPTVSQYTIPTAPATPSAQPLRTITAGPQLVDLTQQAVYSKPLTGSVPTIGTIHNAYPQQDFTLQAQWSRPALAPLIFTGTIVSPYVTPGQADPSINYSVTFTPSTFSPSAPIVVVPPVVGGGLLPGKLGGGIGPYKRPDQVFGEQPIPSPYLTSAPALEPLSAKAISTLREVPRGTQIQTDDDLLAFLILSAMDGPLH